jgi:hypothetical protein
MSQVPPLLDVRDPSALTRRPERHFLRAKDPDETSGQFDNATFAEALAFFKGRRFLSYTISEAESVQPPAPATSIQDSPITFGDTRPYSNGSTPCRMKHSNNLRFESARIEISMPPGKAPHVQSEAGRSGDNAVPLEDS